MRIEIDPFTLSHCIHEGISYLIANSNNIGITFGIWHGEMSYSKAMKEPLWVAYLRGTQVAGDIQNQSYLVCECTWRDARHYSGGCQF